MSDENEKEGCFYGNAGICGGNFGGAVRASLY